jgi:acetyl-CoA carboxylase biotin carboxylase subunit
MYEGWTVPIDYDPLLAKLVGYGETREDAINRLRRALYEYFVGGIKTNISLFRRILHDPDFCAGKLDTGFLDRMLARPGEETDAGRPLIAAIGAGIFATLEPKATLPGVNGAAASAPANGASPQPEFSAWRRAGRIEAMRES